jgi:Uma2 family endonuclease
LAVSRHSAPDPDFHVFGFPMGTSPKPRPVPLVVIEVSDTTYALDSGVKLRAYARRGIEDYWIVNIPQDRLEVYREPGNPTGRRSGWRYASVEFFARGQDVRLLKRPGVGFRVVQMLP